MYYIFSTNNIYQLLWIILLGSFVGLFISPVTILNIVFEKFILIYSRVYLYFKKNILASRRNASIIYAKLSDKKIFTDLMKFLLSDTKKSSGVISHISGNKKSTSVNKESLNRISEEIGDSFSMESIDLKEVEVKRAAVRILCKILMNEVLNSVSLHNIVTKQDTEYDYIIPDQISKGNFKGCLKRKGAEL